MWDTVSGGLQPQPWHNNVIWAPPYSDFIKFGPCLLRYKSVRVHPYAHQQHMKLLKHTFYTSNIDVEYSQQGFTASTMTPQCHLCSALHQFSKIWPLPAQIYQCKGAPICPSRAYKCAKTCYIHLIWMGDAVSSGLKPQPWHHIIIWAPH